MPHLLVSLLFSCELFNVCENLLSRFFFISGSTTFRIYFQKTFFALQGFQILKDRSFVVTGNFFGNFVFELELLDFSIVEPFAKILYEPSHLFWNACYLGFFGLASVAPLFLLVEIICMRMWTMCLLTIFEIRRPLLAPLVHVHLGLRESNHVLIPNHCDIPITKSLRIEL